MSFSVIGALVILCGIYARGHQVLYFQMVFCLFGGTQAIGLPALGGATITPPVLFLPFTVLHALKERGGVSKLHRVAPVTFWLGTLALWGAIAAWLLPRAFEGEISVLTVDRFANEGAVRTYPLRPVSGNITQTTYAFGAVGCVAATRALLTRQAERLEHFRNAVMLLTALNCTTAVIGLVESYTGMPSILDYVRTGYASFGVVREAGLVRIQGTFPEASSFAAFSLILFAFNLRLWERGVRKRYSATLTCVTLLLLLLSTSGTAYAGLTTYLATLALARSSLAFVQGKVNRVLAVLIWALSAVLVLACWGLVFELPFMDSLSHFIDKTILNKLESKSGEERSMWNEHAWGNFLDSWGLGVGLGSARASSFPLVLLSNVGLIGTMLFGAFLFQLFRIRATPPPPEGIAIQAARESIVAGLIAATLVGTVFDLGVLFYGLAAAASIRVHDLPRTNV